MVPKTNAVPLGGRKKRIEQHVERLPEEAFSEVRPARDCSGSRPWEWACCDVAADPEKGMRRWPLVRRSTDDPEDRGYYQAYGSEATPIEELVRVCQERWAVEECFAEAKGEVGLDHYEVRRWDAWYRHVTLCLLAHAFLVTVCLAARNEEDARGRGAKRGISTPISSRRPCRRRGSWSSRWPHPRAEDASFWDGRRGGGRTRRWRPAVARQAWQPNSPRGLRWAQRDRPRRLRSRPKRRGSRRSNGRWFAPCCHRRGAG
jgi:hypothetical protein